MKGHFARVCRRKNKEVHQVEQPSEEGESYDFDSLDFSLDKVDFEMSTEAQKETKRYPDTNINLRINGHKTALKIDSGAEANVIGIDVFEQIQRSANLSGKPVHLKNSSARLRPYNSPPNIYQRSVSS